MAVSAPLTTPTPNAGAHAQGVLLASQALSVLQKAMAMVDPTTALGQAIADTLRRHGKQVGSPPEEQKINSLQSQIVDAQRNIMQRIALQHMAQSNRTGQLGGTLTPGAATPVASPSVQPSMAA